MLPLVLAFLVSAEPAPDSSTGSGIIRSFCLVAFNAAMQSANQTPPDGMGDYTCDCFMERLQAGAGIEAAREQCTEEAAERFPL